MSNDDDALRAEIEDLRAKIDDQRRIIEQQTERIDALDRMRDEGDDHTTAADDGESGRNLLLGRRGFLQSAVVGALGGGVGYSLADQNADTGGPSTDSFNIHNDGSIQGQITDEKRLKNLTGANLWIDSNGVLNAAGSGAASFEDGSLVAEPRNVQHALDRAAATEANTVKLKADETYTQDDTFPLHVKSDVVLDFNGAVLYGSGEHQDDDLIHIHPQAQVLNPKIDLWNEWEAYDEEEPYRGTVFTFDSKYGSYFADGTTIRGGWTMAVESTGTWMYFGKHNSAERRANHLAGITVNTNLRKVNEPAPVGPTVIDTGIHIDTTGPPGYINSLVFRGAMRGAKTAILQEGQHPNNAHIFDGVFQQPDGSDYFWHIKPETFARGSVVRGKVWDINETTYPGGIAWLIDSQHENAFGNAINAKGFKPTYARNNSESNHYVTDPTVKQTTVI